MDDNGFQNTYMGISNIGSTYVHISLLHFATQHVFVVALITL